MKVSLTLIGGILTAILLFLYVFGTVVIMDSLIYRYFN